MNEKALAIAVVVIVFVLGGMALTPFVPALLWSVFVAVSLHPLHDRMTVHVGGRRGIATAITVIGLLVVVLLPALLLFRAILGILPELALALSDGGALTSLGIELPAGTSATWVELWNELKDDVARIRSSYEDELRLVLSSVVLEGRLIALFVLEFLLGLVLAAAILQNAGPLGELTQNAVRKLGGDRGADLGARSVLTIRYTVLGILGSAAVQTAVAAFAYWLVGAPHWPLLAFLTFMLGLLQIGPILIWLPLAIWLGMEERMGMAIFMGLWGLFAVGLSDNVVKALVVARGADLPAILVFLGALGGLLVWGVVGIFLGPVILALCLELVLWWLGWDRETDPPEHV